MARKWFAQDLGKKGPLYFAEYDGRLNAVLDTMTTSKYISLFHITLPKENT